MCLEAKIPVNLRKSTSSCSEEAQEIKNIRDKNNGFLAVTYNYSGYPMVRELRDLIKKGTLGEIFAFSGEMPQEGFIRVDAQATSQSHKLGGFLIVKSLQSILDLAVHLHELIDYTIGEKPVSVVSDQESDGWFKDIVDNVSCLCRYTNNIQGQIWFSKSALGNRKRIKTANLWFKGICRVGPNEPRRTCVIICRWTQTNFGQSFYGQCFKRVALYKVKAGHPAGFIEAFANLYADIADSLINYKDTGKMKSEEVFSVELALEGLKMLEAMVESSCSKSWQRVDLGVKEKLNV